MKNNSFLSKIRVSIIFLIVIFGIYIAGIHIVYTYVDFLKKKDNFKKDFLNNQKQLIKNEVTHVVEMVNYEKEKKAEITRKKVKRNVIEAYKIATNIYKKYKNSLTEKELISVIATTLEPIRYDNGRGYFFIVDLNGNVLLNAASPKLNNKNVLNLKDVKGNYFIKDMISVVKKKGEGFVTYFWKNFLKISSNSLKISFVKLVKPLNIFIGTGIYIDDILDNIPENVYYYVQNHRFGKNSNGYIFILKLLNINGGKDFAIMYANANRPDLVGKLLSDDFKDAKGKEFRKEFLKGIRKHGECYVTYWYKKLNSNKIAPKISFFKLTSDKKFIVASGVYIDELNKELTAMYEKFKQDNIKKILIFLTSVFILVMIFIIMLNSFSKNLSYDFSYFLKLFKEASEKNTLINTNKLIYSEFKELSKNINNILKDKMKFIKKLELSEKKFRTIFEKSSTPMLLLDKEQFIDCNEATINMLKGKNKEEILFSPGHFSPEYQPDGRLSNEKAKAIIEDVYRTGESKNFEWLHKRLNGELFWSVINLSLIPYEDRYVIFVIWTDISELKELQQQLEQEKEKLSITLYSIGDAVITTDVKGNVEFMNKVAQNLTGWSTEEAKGKNLETVFKIINEDTRKKVENPVNKVLKEGSIVGLANHTLLISKDGKEYNIADSAAPIRDKNSNIIGVVLVFRDESEKSRLRKELLEKEKMKSVSNLAAGIAHDFNNILTGIYGNLEMAKLNAGNKKMSMKYMNLMFNSLERAKKLTTQLLTFAKGGTPILRSVDISDVLKDVTEFNLSGSNVKVHYKFSKNLWNSKVDKEQIGEVISNIVINAKQAMNDRGNLYISIENLNEELSFKELGKNEKFLKISIRDEGKGIPKKFLNNIFDPFFTTKEKGSGIGLSVVHSIIEKHNGFIKVESEEAKGATFFIYLPALENGKEKDRQDNNHLMFKHSLSGKLILVMDDEALIREVSQNILGEFGAVVETAKNGEEAVKKYSEKKFDIVIMDLTVRGGMGGEKAAKKILNMDKNAKIIVASGYFNSPVMAEYKKYGFKGRIMKPFKVDETLAEIVKVINS